MIAALRDFHFLQPWWLLALALLPLVWWMGTRRDPARRDLSRLVDAALLPHLLTGRAEASRWPSWLLVVGWTLVTLAMAGPAWNRVSHPLYANRTAQVVAISLSQRMLARDVEPSRIARARFKAHDLLASNRDGWNALIGYAGEAFVVAPLTTDVHSLDDLLDAMSPDTMPVDGNDAARAIARGVALIQGAHAKTGSLVLLTDTADDAAEVAARAALAAGIHVSVLGVGTPQGGPVALARGGFLHDANGDMLLARRDDKALAALAAAGGGRYAPLRADHTDIDALHAVLQAGTGATASAQVGDQWQDRGPWLLLPLLPLMALAFRRGWLLLLPLVLLPCLPGSAHAGTWRDWWQRPDQQAAQALQQGQPRRAQQLASDPAWRGAAAYRAGDYAAAAQALAAAPGADGAYNLGNALARQGNYPQALAAYGRALKLDPTHADAKANRQAVEDWLRQHQPPPKPSGQQGDKGDKGDKGVSSGGQGEQSSSDAKDAQRPSSSGEPASTDKGQARPDDAGKGNPDAAHDQQGQQDHQDRQDPQGTPPSASSTAAAPPSAAQRDRAAQAQQALKDQMDQALSPSSARSGAAPAHQLGALGDEASSPLPADLRQALQRVPDDPGALLRRKFELEYRQRHGGAPNQDDQP